MQRRSKLNSSDSIPVINYVGIPLSGQLSELAKDGYYRLKEFGPNDGLTVITDALAPNSVTIPEFGVDHFFQDPGMELRTVALASALVMYLRSKVVPGDSF